MHIIAKYILQAPPLKMSACSIFFLNTRLILVAWDKHNGITLIKVMVGIREAQRQPTYVAVHICCHNCKRVKKSGLNRPHSKRLG